MSILDVSHRKQLMITGGSTASLELSYLARLIGYEAIVGQYNILSNGSDGVDTAVADGAIMACLLHNIDPHDRIKVFRPICAPVPSFDFGHLRISGEDYVARRNFVIDQSDAVVLIGGGSGTTEVFRYAEKCGKVTLPVGIGSSKEAAVLLWHEAVRASASDAGRAKLSHDDLLVIGPSQYNLKAAAAGAIQILNKVLFATNQQ
ncbi:MAG: hypothetical protein QM820_06410 [Minicystis sp.]